jgi:hypothetical protein
VLNVLTGDLDLTLHEGRMLALVSIAQAPPDRRERYTRFIRAVVPPSARDALEDLLKIVIPDPFLDGIIEQGREQGRAQGQAIGEARMLLRCLDARFTITDDIRKRVTDCSDLATIEAWFDKALSVATVEEVFAG